MTIPSVLPVLLRLWCFTLLCAAVQANATDQPVLRWCMDHFPGMHEFHHNSRQPVGPSVEMMQELASRAGFRLQMSGKTPASRCLKQLADGEADLMTNLLYSAKRADSVILIRFAGRNPDRLYLAANDPRRITALPQLTSLSIVTVRGFGLHPTLQQVLDALPAAQKQQVQSTEIALQMVAKGRADATLLPVTQVSQIFRQQPDLASQLREVAFTIDKVVPQNVHLGLSRKVTDPAIEARIRSALQQMKQDGTLARMFGDKLLD